MTDALVPHDFNPHLWDIVEVRGQVVEVSDLHCGDGELLVTVRLRRADVFNESLGPEFFQYTGLTAPEVTP